MSSPWGCDPRPPLACLGDPCLNKSRFITIFNCGEGCADHSVCTWGGCASPSPPASLKPSMLTVQKVMSHHVCSRERLCASCCLQMGGGCAPPKKPSMLMAKHHVITTVAVGQGCADHFVYKGPPFFKTTVLTGQTTCNGHVRRKGGYRRIMRILTVHVHTVHVHTMIIRA